MPPSLPPSPLPASFLLKKSRILSSLSVPVEQYDDLSPKGSVDVGIRELIDEVNAREGYVTTSSCAGRISVFLEGRKCNLEGKDEGKRGDGDGEEGGERATTAGVGGKGGGGRWLFVSHDPVDVDGRARDSDVEVIWAEKLGMRRFSGDDESLKRGAGMGIETRFIHFKFEPMVCIFSSFSSDLIYVCVWC
jgi:tRNA wybutosine-synthesizing protein 3